MDVFWTLPPVSRTVTAGAVAVSALGFAGIIDLGKFIWVSDYVFTARMLPQLWRLVTAFLITKPKFAILFDPYMLYNYGSGLERESSRFSHPGDFFVYTVFCGSIIVALAGYFLDAFTLLPALTLAYAYTYAQDNPTRKVSMFIITFDAKFLPLGLLFMTLVIDGPQYAIPQATGLLAAHLYDFLTRIWPTFGGGRNYIKTPSFVAEWFGAAPGAAQQRSYGTAQQGGGGAGVRPAGRSTGIWNERGPGRRLGGE